MNSLVLCISRPKKQKIPMNWLVFLVYLGSSQKKPVKAAQNCPNQKYQKYKWIHWYFAFPNQKYQKYKWIHWYFGFTWDPARRGLSKLLKPPEARIPKIEKNSLIFCPHQSFCFTLLISKQPCCFLSKPSNLSRQTAHVLADVLRSLKPYIYIYIYIHNLY